MANNEVAITIYEERLQVGIEMVQKFVAKNKLNLSDFEKADLACRIASSLFIEKNKAFRAGQIPKGFD